MFWDPEVVVICSNHIANFLVYFDIIEIINYHIRLSIRKRKRHIDDTLNQHSSLVDGFCLFNISEM